MGALLPLSVGVMLLCVFVGGETPPKVELKYWGPGEPKDDDKTIKPFKIQIPDQELKYLKEKLELTRPLPPPLEGSAFNYGTNTAYLATFLDFWKTKYNWREREAYMNTFPQFTTQIGGLDVHFIHVKPDPVKSKGKEVLPLLLLHGWPGSFLEFLPTIPLLTEPRQDSDYVFEVVLPSLPGTGFSQAPAKMGYGIPQAAVTYAELMTRLGFKQFYVQGGDHGAVVGNNLAILASERVLGYHSNFCLPSTTGARLRSLLAYLFPSFSLNKEQKARYKSQFTDMALVEGGYLHIQATKPDSIGVALTDSPAGLAAYIVEKFSTWTKKTFRDLPDGGLGYYSTVDLLDNINMWWFSKSITSSMRAYAEIFNAQNTALGIDKLAVKVPVGCAVFPSDLLFYPRWVLKTQFPNLLTYNEQPVGGHFASFEQPKLLADDIWNFVRVQRKWKMSNKL